MIGRAGRPQFDTSATAIIMTKDTTKSRYESLANGTQKIESSLHLHLLEHLNAEIVLKTLRDVGMVLEWIKSTYFYIRVLKNPQYYKVNPAGSRNQHNKLSIAERETFSSSTFFSVAECCEK